MIRVVRTIGKPSLALRRRPFRGQTTGVAKGSTAIRFPFHLLAHSASVSVIHTADCATGSLSRRAHLSTTVPFPWSAHELMNPRTHSTELTTKSEPVLPPLRSKLPACLLRLAKEVRARMNHDSVMARIEIRKSTRYARASEGKERHRGEEGDDQRGGSKRGRKCVCVELTDCKAIVRLFQLVHQPTGGSGGRTRQELTGRHAMACQGSSGGPYQTAIALTACTSS